MVNSHLKFLVLPAKLLIRAGLKLMALKACTSRIRKSKNNKIYFSRLINSIGFACMTEVKKYPEAVIANKNNNI